MAVDLLFILKKKLPAQSPDPEQIGGNYHVVYGKSLLPTVEFGPGEEVLASIQSRSCTLVLTNGRIIRKHGRGVNWGWWWDIKNFAYPSKDVFPEGDSYGARVIPAAFLEFTDGTVMKFDDVAPTEASFLFSLVGIAEWVCTQRLRPGRAPRDVGILYARSE